MVSRHNNVTSDGFNATNDPDMRSLGLTGFLLVAMLTLGICSFFCPTRPSYSNPGSYSTTCPASQPYQAQRQTNDGLPSTFEGEK